MITGCTSGTTIALDTSKFLPDMDQAEFLTGIINMFNLYFTIDVTNKIISFETYDTLFTNKVGAYDITGKVLENTIKVEKPEEVNNSILFKNADNMKAFGDNAIIASNDESLLDVSFKNTTEVNNGKVFNYLSNSTTNVSLVFGVPAVKRMYIWNERDYAGSDFNAGIHAYILPDISKQTPNDNDSKNFNKNDTDTNVYNTEDTIQHKGNPSLYYYYGLSASQFEQKVGVGYQSDYFYVNLAGVNQKVPITSPFIYTENRQNIVNALTGSTNNEETILASYIQGNYLMLGTGHTETDFSLVFIDNESFGDTLFTKFYKNKYNRYVNGEILNMTILINNEDWKTLQINKPIKYLNQYYSIMSIQNYDIVSGLAEIKLIKQI